MRANNKGGVSMTGDNRRSLIGLASAMFIFGTIGILRRMIHLDSALIAFSRGIIGSAFLVVFSKARRKPIKGRLDRARAVKLAISGALIGINWIFLFEAYNYTSVSVATLCYYMAPTFVVIFASAVFKERITLFKGICAAISLAGMILISGIIENGIPKQGEIRGIAFALAAAVLYASVVLINKSLSGIDPFQKTTIQLFFAAIAMVPYLLMIGGFALTGTDSRTIMLLLIAGVVHTGISYVLYFGSMDGLKTQTVALLAYIDPITALVLSHVLLSERLTALGIAGAAMIILSAIVSEVKND